MTGTGIEASALFTGVWWAVAAMTVIAAFLVVHLTDLVKAAMALIAAFLGIAALFVLLGAEFLAVVQVLVYVGAVSILLIFGILLIRDVQRGSPFNRLRAPAALLVGVLLAAIVFVVAGARWGLLADAALSEEVLARGEAVLAGSTVAIGDLLLREYALALEALALLLMAALLGAIALVRER